MTRTTTRPTGTAAPGLAVHPFADVLLPEPEHDAGAMAPAGQLWTTTTDLARWAPFLAGRPTDCLAAETLAEMVEPHHVNDEPGKPWIGGARARLAGLERRRRAVRRHGGSMPGFRAALRVRPMPVCRGGSAAASDGTASAGTWRGRRRRRHAHEHDGIPTTRTVVDDLLEGLARHEPAPVEPWSASGDATLLEPRRHVALGAVDRGRPGRRGAPRARRARCGARVAVPARR